MIINATRMAVLEVLDRAQSARTAREIGICLGIKPSTVKAHLLELWRDEGTYRSWATPVGTGPRNATTYAITPFGREWLATLRAEEARR